MAFKKQVEIKDETKSYGITQLEANVYHAVDFLRDPNMDFQKVHTYAIYFKTKNNRDPRIYDLVIGCASEELRERLESHKKTAPAWVIKSNQ